MGLKLKEKRLKQTNSKLSYTLHALLCWVRTGWATNVSLLIFNFSTFSLSTLLHQVRSSQSVSKTMKISLEPPSSPSIPAGGQVTQQLQVVNNNRAPLKMKLRLSFVAGGIPVNDQGEVANFPST